MARKKTTVTMKQVAELAGVSTATVSRALSNPEKLATETRNRVEEAVLTCRYTIQNTSNIAAAKTVLLLINQLTDLVGLDIIESIKESFSEQGYTLLVCYNTSSISDNAYCQYLMLTRQICAVIQIGTAVYSHWLSQQQIKLPQIIIGASHQYPNALTIDIDHLFAAYNAVTHLCQTGCTRIAYIGGHQESTINQYHEQGYQRALQRKKIAYDKYYIIHGDISYAHGQQAAQKLMSLPLPPNGIYCHHDMIAIGAIHQLKQLNIKIPQNISVMSFGNTPLSEYQTPALTSVMYPSDLIGKHTVKLLLKWLKQPEIKPEPVIFSSEIIQRETTINSQH